MKNIRALSIFGFILFISVACQKADFEDATSNTKKRGVQLVALKDQSLVELPCLAQAAKMNVDPKTVCPTIKSAEIKTVSTSRDVEAARGTCKKKCGDSSYYQCGSGSCGWNDFYSNPYYSTYYYYYQPTQLPSSWYGQYGMSPTYVNNYIYNYNSGTQYINGYPNYGYGNYPTQYPSYGNNSCGSVWYGYDYTRIGGCQPTWMWR